MSWMRRSPGYILTTGGEIAIDEACCCGGCCPGILIITQPEVIGTILEATLITDDTGCFGVGSTMDLSDEPSPGIWTSANAGEVGFFGNAAWRGLSVGCQSIDGVDRLVMIWDFSETGVCPLIDRSSQGTFTWDPPTGQCDPFEFVFCWPINEVFLNEETGLYVPGCNCDGSQSMPGNAVGEVCVRIRIKQ